MCVDMFERIAVEARGREDRGGGPWTRGGLLPDLPLLVHVLLSNMSTVHDAAPKPKRTYRLPIYRVLKQVHSDVGIMKKAMNVMHCGHVREDRGGGVEANEVGVEVAQIIQKRMPCKTSRSKSKEDLPAPTVGPDAGISKKCGRGRPSKGRKGGAASSEDGEKRKKRRPEPKTNYHWHIHRVLKQVQGENARSPRRRGRSPRRTAAGTGTSTRFWSRSQVRRREVQEEEAGAQDERPTTAGTSTRF